MVGPRERAGGPGEDLCLRNTSGERKTWEMSLAERYTTARRTKDKERPNLCCTTVALFCMMEPKNFSFLLLVSVYHFVCLFCKHCRLRVLNCRPCRMYEPCHVVRTRAPQFKMPPNLSLFRWSCTSQRKQEQHFVHLHSNFCLRRA